MQSGKLIKAHWQKKEIINVKLCHYWSTFPVSYTHLDVYKRQPPSIAYEQMIKNACLRTGNTLYIHVFYFTETNNIQFTLSTVYVVQHMYWDVYKRQ